MNLLCEPDPAKSGEALKCLDEMRGEFGVASSIFGTVLHEERAERVRLTANLNRQLKQQRDKLDASQRHSDELRTQLDVQARDLDIQARDIERLVEQRDKLAGAEQAARAAYDAASLEKAKVNAHLEAMANELQDLQVEFDSAQSAAQAVQRELASARLRLDAAYERIDSLANELVAARNRIDALLASGSWRVTAPLRAVFRLLTRNPS
jgi:chromosome segregation ATPase